VTPFSFEHVFDAPSIDAVFAAYFDPDHQQEQDRAVQIAEREVLELNETADELRRVCRVVPRRQLPALVRPFVAGQLHYIETVIWRRKLHELTLEIRPSMLDGRARIEGTYRLESPTPGAVRRCYVGQVSVDVAFVANRIEKGILAEFSRSLPLAAACTQAWLDRHSSRSVCARA
jgi:hypothetical protein